MEVSSQMINYQVFCIFWKLLRCPVHTCNGAESMISAPIFKSEYHDEMETTMFGLMGLEVTTYGVAVVIEFDI